MVEAAPQVRAERIAAIAAAVNAVHSDNAAQQLARQLTSAIRQIEAGEKGVTVSARPDDRSEQQAGIRPGRHSRASGGEEAGKASGQGWNSSPATASGAC
ncbi:MAG: hypothetical protein R2838_07215 [Caldilineaceae bacterium]